MNAQSATARADRIKPAHIGDHLREWRQRSPLSQLDLAGDAEISARHLSFVETGRAAPSRDMVLKLAERLEVPLRERNVLLVAAGFAPAFPQRSLDDPALKSARAAIDLVLRAHEPNPALAYDRHWNLVSANRMVMPLLEGIPARLLGQPFNILRLAFHPEALAARTVNLAEWCGHLLERLHRQCEATADPELIRLYQDLRAHPIPAWCARGATSASAGSRMRWRWCRMCRSKSAGGRSSSIPGCRARASAATNTSPRNSAPAMPIRDSPGRGP